MFKSGPTAIDGISETPLERSQDIACDEGKIAKDPASSKTDAIQADLPILASNSSVVSAEQWEQASRAVRTASWGAIFYLTVTDILGPTSAP